MAYELSSFVGDNIVGNSETVEFEVGAGLRLNSLSELVNSHQDMGEPPGTTLKSPTMSTPQTANGQVMVIV